jgi:hypothetical protein
MRRTLLKAKVLPMWTLSNTDNEAPKLVIPNKETDAPKRWKLRNDMELPNSMT